MSSTSIEQSLTVRALTRDDLGGVVAIDAAIEGRPRSAYVARRLAAAMREPTLHAQFAASTSDGLAGYILARVLHGEFGRSDPALRLEMVGVRANERSHGVGKHLFEALVTWAQRHGIRELRTSASWRDSAMLHWLDTMGFELAPLWVLDRDLAIPLEQADSDDAVSLPPGQGPGHEIDFGAPQDNDFERLARDQAEVRSMTPADLREIVRIDRSITGRDRTAYIAGRLGEAMDNSAIRVSLAARLNGAIVGYLMARADLGDFGRTAPVAVIDTLGVDPACARQGVGRALVRQLFANLAALCIERVETVVAPSDPTLPGFFQGMGFASSQRLPFMRRLDAAK